MIITLEPGEGFGIAGSVCCVRESPEVNDLVSDLINGILDGSLALDQLCHTHSERLTPLRRTAISTAIL